MLSSQRPQWVWSRLLVEALAAAQLHGRIVSCLLAGPQIKGFGL